jgi:hypothetical protein
VSGQGRLTRQDGCRARSGDNARTKGERNDQCGCQRGLPFAEREEFVDRHAGHPFLQHDPLYALSEPIIEAIKAEAPTFFTEDEEYFERDLAKTASFGFFHRRALGLTATDTRPDPESGLSLQDRHGRSAQAIAEMMAEELRRDGLTEGLRWIYRFHELVLMRRYGLAHRGHVDDLDRALATLIVRDKGRGEDTVKKPTARTQKSSPREMIVYSSVRPFTARRGRRAACRRSRFSR